MQGTQDQVHANENGKGNANKNGETRRIRTEETRKIGVQLGKQWNKERKRAYLVIFSISILVVYSRVLNNLSTWNT